MNPASRIDRASDTAYSATLRATLALAVLVLLAGGACRPSAPSPVGSEGAPAGEPTAIDIGYPGPDDAAADPLEATDAGGYPSPDAGDASPETASLAAALSTRDYDALIDLMADPFTVGYWRSEGVSLTPAEAKDLLFTSLLPVEADIDTTTDRSRFPRLDGAPVEAMFGPDVVVHAVLFSRGWGADGAGEALLYLSEVDGGVRWHGLIWAATGFEDGAAGDAAPDADGQPMRTFTAKDGRAFAVSVPEGWTVIEFGSGLTVQSFVPEEAGRGGIDPAQTKIDIALIEPAPASFEDALSTIRSGSPDAPSQEVPFTLPSGARGQKLIYADATAAVVAVGESFVVATVYGDPGPLDGVVASLAPPENVP